MTEKKDMPDATEGVWQESKGIHTGEIPAFKEQLEASRKLKELLEMQVEQDKKLVLELREKVARLRHGGGR